MIAKRDEVIARQAAEIAVLRQTIDALCRRVFGKSSETLDPAQLELMLGGDFARTTPPPSPSSTRCHPPSKTAASPPPASSPKSSTTASSATSRTTGKPKCSLGWECTSTVKPSATGRCSPPTGSLSSTGKSNTNIGAPFTDRSTKPPSITSNPAAAKPKPATSGRLTSLTEPSSTTGMTAATPKA